MENMRKKNSTSNIISAEQLLQSLGDPDLYIADCRFDLAATLIGWMQYKEAHIPGARYVSLDKDLSGKLGQHGGRHPLPAVEEMERRFGELGIARGSSRVVAYDDAGGSYAARLWWMLRYLGHDQAQILNGGYQAFLTVGGKPESAIPANVPVIFQSKVRPEMLAYMEDVRSADKACLLVDARARERYRGEIEPIDRIAGHIPGAVNLPWMENVNTDFTLKSAEILQELYCSFPPATIMYCGSGVTSALNVLIMEELGFPLPKLYAGSWSDWISYEENAVALGE
jgi:thiosulfate/3-mercaptopyruvate sulfurtransferase